MSFLSRLFSRAPPRAVAAPRKQSTQSSENLATSQLSTRRELLRVVLRDTLVKHGIPTAWIGAEMVQAPGRNRKPGMHMRLLVRHWDPRLLTYGVAFEKSFAARVMVFDPTAAVWLAGISWQFALLDEDVCPPMPEPAIWSTLVVTAAAEAEIAVAQAARPDARAELDRMFAETDAKKLKRYADDVDGADEKPNFEATQPMFRSTEPAPL